MIIIPIELEVPEIDEDAHSDLFRHRTPLVAGFLWKINARAEISTGGI